MELKFFGICLYKSDNKSDITITSYPAPPMGLISILKCFIIMSEKYFKYKLNLNRAHV